jgi:DNA-binding transcriptional LysR family regulator
MGRHAKSANNQGSRMDDVDLNLLFALDALLAEGSVTGAARRLGLSSSAMSRTLARLRSATGDPLLVRAGRGLVPTPRAAELGDHVHRLARDVRAVFSPQSGDLDLASLERTFTIRANEGFVQVRSGKLVAAVAAAAPRVRLRFAPKPQKDAGPLRQGDIDLEIGVLGSSAPEIRMQSLFREHFVGVARPGHPLLTEGPVTPERYAACQHVVASRRGSFTGPVDDALQELGLRRTIVAVVPGFLDAMRIAHQSDLVALVPRSCADSALASTALPGQGLASFDLPVRTPEIVVSMMWHPRLHADPAHRWLRATVMAACREAQGPIDPLP